LAGLNLLPLLSPLSLNDTIINPYLLLILFDSSSSRVISEVLEYLLILLLVLIVSHGLVHPELQLIHGILIN
jgi:hypothetical protein